MAVVFSAVCFVGAAFFSVTTAVRSVNATVVVTIAVVTVVTVAEVGTRTSRDVVVVNVVVVVVAVVAAAVGVTLAHCRPFFLFLRVRPSSSRSL